MDEETIKWVLSNTAIDPISHVQQAAVVFMLYYSLELKHSLLKTSEQLMKDLPTEICNFGGTSLYVAGSDAQGFFLHTTDFLESRDIDIVAVHEKDIRKKCGYDKESVQQRLTEQFKGDLNETDNDELWDDKTKHMNVIEQSDPFYLNIETWEDTYPGYVMLRKCRKHENPVQPSLRNHYVSSLETTKSRTDFWQNLLDYLGEEFSFHILDHPRDREANVLLSIHTQGPATTVQICNLFLQICIEADLVYALRYPKDFKNSTDSSWPDPAQRWLERTPASGWPSRELKQDTIASGCLLVPKGHIGSKREDYEWRISFSLAELKLAQSLNRIQREIVHVLKVLLSEEQYKYDRASVNAKLESYFILNILFSESETIKPESWQERNIAAIMFRLFDKLATSIRNKNLPNYFVEDNNLLFKLSMEQVKLGKGEFKHSDTDEMMNSDEYTDFALYTVLRLRHDPLGQLLQQGSYHRLPQALHKAVFEPFVKEAKTTTSFMPDIYVTTLIKLANAHLYMSNFKEAIIYINDAEIFYAGLEKQEAKTDLGRGLAVTKAVCSYMTGDFNTAIQIFENIKQNSSFFSDILLDNEKIITLLIARGLISRAADESSVKRKLLITNVRRLLENTLSQSFDATVALELVNLFMSTGFYPEADELLMKIKEYIIEEEDKYLIEDEENDGSCIYYRQAYAVPVIEEPICVIDDEKELVQNLDIFQLEGKDNESDEMSNFEINSATFENRDDQIYCGPSDLDRVERCSTESSEIAIAAENYKHPQFEKIEEKMFEKESLSAHSSLIDNKQANSIFGTEGILDIKMLHSDVELVSNDDMEVQESQHMLTDEFDSLDMKYINDFGESENCDMDPSKQEDTHKNVFDQSDYEFKQTILHSHNLAKDLDSSGVENIDSFREHENTDTGDNVSETHENIYMNLFEEMDDQYDSILKLDDGHNFGRMLDFHKNQDLINLSALARAFTELGLFEEAQRVRKRILDEIHQRQKEDERVTVDALEHDLDIYISNALDYQAQADALHEKDWENPFCIFKEDVMYSLADENILDQVLKALVYKCGVVWLSMNDLFFHHHIQLAKYDGKTEDALEMVKKIRNENLKSIHFDALGDNIAASISSWYAAYKSQNEPVYIKVSKWMKKLIEAISKFEPRNQYPDSVFK